jgi:hypothetical protein
VKWPSFRIINNLVYLKEMKNNITVLILQRPLIFKMPSSGMWHHVSLTWTAVFGGTCYLHLQGRRNNASEESVKWMLTDWLLFCGENLGGVGGGGVGFKDQNNGLRCVRGNLKYCSQQAGTVVSQQVLLMVDHIAGCQNPLWVARSASGSRLKEHQWHI